MMTHEANVGRQIGFVVLSLISVASLVVAGFCGMRWAFMDVPTTTESHLAEFKEAYQDLTAAQLVREYENMEKIGLAGNLPYQYKQDGDVKATWGRNALIASIVCVVCGLTAIVLASSKPASQTDT